MKRFHPSYLQQITARLAEHVGVSAEDAEIFAHALVDADVHGTSAYRRHLARVLVRRTLSEAVQRAKEAA